MDINVNIGGPIVDAINNLANALSAGVKAEQVVAAARTSSRSKKAADPAPEAPANDNPQGTNPDSRPSTPEGSDKSLTAAEAAEALKGHANKPAPGEGNEPPAATQPAAEPAAKTEPATESPSESAKSEIKIEDVRAKLAALSKAGKTTEVKGILQQFNAASVSALKPEQFADVLKAAEALR